MIEERTLHSLLTMYIVQLKVSHEAQIAGGLEDSQSITLISAWILWQLVWFDLECVSFSKEMIGNAEYLRPSALCQIW